MYGKKPFLAVRRQNNQTCPVCGQTTYSAGGIHPQCAMNQEYASQRALLLAEKKAAAEADAAAGSPPPLKRARW